MNRHRACVTRTALIALLMIMMLASIGLLAMTTTAAEIRPDDCPVGFVCLLPNQGVNVWCNGTILQMEFYNGVSGVASCSLGSDRVFLPAVER